MTKKTQRRKHSTEFKVEAVRAVEQRGERTVAEVAKSLGVAESGLHTWRKQYGSDGSNDRGESAEQELHRLRREVADLKRDRDALVKSIAVFVRDRK